jgi:endoglucanase
MAPLRNPAKPFGNPMREFQNTMRVLVANGLLAFMTTIAVAADCDVSRNIVRGISLASAEFQPDHVPGIYNHDYVYPPARSLDYYKGKGFDLIRLPFLWERLQRTPFAVFDAPELSRMKQFVAAARDRCMRVILSPHNFGRYSLKGTRHLVGSAEIPNEAFADFWKRMAIEFSEDPAVYAFSLMNEPHDTNGLWKRAAQVGLDAIRGVDRMRLVLVPGDHWTGAWSWKRLNGDFGVTDPSGRTVYEAHQYFDSDHSGTYRENYTQNKAYPDIGIDQVRPFAEWLRAHNARGIIGEFGVPNDDPRWLEVVDRLLPWLGREQIPWIYWAGGPRWGNYPLSAEPKAGVDAPIMGVLAKHEMRVQ